MLKDIVPLEERYLDLGWKPDQVADFLLWLDIDAVMVLSVSLTKILECFHSEKRMYVLLITSFDFVSVKTISSRILGKKPMGKKFKNPFTGQETSLSDLSCMPCVIVGKMVTEAYSIPLNIIIYTKHCENFCL